jgi:hypothetical protein
MSLFVVRVELLNIKLDHPSYSLLHQRMRDANYLRFFEQPGGKTEDLPFGHYIKIDHTKHPEAIIAEVEEIVRGVHKDGDHEGESLFTVCAVDRQRDFVLRRVPAKR